jgi:hypothetical protein
VYKSLLLAVWADQEVRSNMKVIEVAFSGYVYSKMTDYDRSYLEFRTNVSRPLNLSEPAERLQTIKWLNKWGCRQFAIGYHDHASEQIGEWYRQFKHRLLDPGKTTLDMSAPEIATAGAAFENLSGRKASERKGHSGKKIDVRIGPTGAAKILFALRPDAYLPWDIPIRDDIAEDKPAITYPEYLNKAQFALRELSSDCQRLGIQLQDLPQLVGRPEQSLAKMIDEHNWVTITRSCPVPSPETLLQWTKWL